jgi:hypothetical protein
VQRDIRRRVNQLLAKWRVVDGRSVPAYPAFAVFDPSAPPAWWDPNLKAVAWGDVLGVYHNEPLSGARAIVVTTRGLALLNEDARPDHFVEYAKVVGWDRLFKEPTVSTSLTVWTESGERIELPFLAREGDAFSFVQFLGAAMQDAKGN